MNLCQCGHSHYVHSAVGCRECGECSGFRERVEVDPFVSMGSQMVVDLMAGIENGHLTSAFLYFDGFSIPLHKRYYKFNDGRVNGEVVVRWLLQSDYPDFPDADVVGTLIWEKPPDCQGDYIAREAVDKLVGRSVPKVSWRHVEIVFDKVGEVKWPVQGDVDG